MEVALIKTPLIAAICLIPPKKNRIKRRGGTGDQVKWWVRLSHKGSPLTSDIRVMRCTVTPGQRNLTGRPLTPPPARPRTPKFIYLFIYFIVFCSGPFWWSWVLILLEPLTVPPKWVGFWPTGIRTWRAWAPLMPGHCGLHYVGYVGKVKNPAGDQ